MLAKGRDGSSKIDAGSGDIQPKLRIKEILWLKQNLVSSCNRNRVSGKFPTRSDLLMNEDGGGLDHFGNLKIS